MRGWMFVRFESLDQAEATGGKLNRAEQITQAMSKAERHSKNMKRWMEIPKDA